MTINKTAGGRLAAITALVLAVALQVAPSAGANETRPEEASWSDWAVIGAGFVARRREPPGLDLPPVERRLADTQSRNTRKLSRGGRDDARQPEPTDTAAQAAVHAAPTLYNLWFYTTREGLHSVTITELAARSGASEVRIRNMALQGRLSITNAGNPVSWYVDEQSDAIWFVAASFESFHTAADAYHFVFNGRFAQPIAAGGDATPTLPGTPAPFTDTLRFEEEPDFQFSVGPVAAEPDADYWFWDYLYGGYKDQIEVALRVPHPAPGGTARMRISLRGWTDLEYGDEHEVYARLNGVDIGSSISWDGFDAAELVAEFDQDLLQPGGDNILTLHNSYAPGTHPGQFLDAVELSYSRMPTAENGALWLRAATAGTQRVDGLRSEQVVVLESPRGQAILREDVLLQPDDQGGWSVTFEAAEGVDYLVAERAGAYLATVAADFPSTLAKRNNAADYLIIAPREFSQTAQNLADYRGNRFGQVKVVWLDDIYDEFGSGREDPAAITAFMRNVQDKWLLAPSVVMIIGNGSLDHKDRMGYGDSFVPVSMVSTPWAIAPSDDRLLDNASQTSASFAIGRLPITSDEEGLAYLDKLVAHESGSYGNERFRAVLVADNPDEAGDFQANSEQLAEQLLLGSGFDSVVRLYHPQHGVRAGLTLSSTWEVGYVNYDGHGSSGQVGDGKEKFITAADADLLQNTAYPVFSALTCAAGDYSWPGTRSLAGALVLNPAGGAIAALAPTGLSLDADAHKLGTAFVDSLFAGMNSVGDALLEAKIQTAGSISGFMPLVYAVVGEPAVLAR